MSYCYDEPKVDYPIDDQNDISVELSKKSIIQSINFEDIVESLEGDGLDQDQINIVIKQIYEHIEQIKKF